MTESGFGMWWDPSDPDQNVAGHLTWEPLRRPALSLLEPPTNMWAGADLIPGTPMVLGEQVIPMLHGRLAGQGVATLLGCRLGGMSAGSTMTFQLVVDRVLIGVLLESPDERFLRRVEVVLPALTAVLGSHPVRPVSIPKPRSRQVNLTLDQRRQSWKEGTTEITWGYRPSVSFGRTAAGVEVTPTVSLTNSTTKSLDYWLDEWIVPLNRLMEVATGTVSNPRAITGWIKKNLSSKEKMLNKIALWTSGVGEHEYDYKPQQVLMRATDVDSDSLGLLQVIRQMRRLSAEQEVFLGLLSAAMAYPDRPMRNRYLDLVSGLEAYHAQKYEIGSMTRDDYKAKSKTVLEAVKTSDLDAATGKFIKKWLRSEPSHSLEYRLRRLATDAGVREGWQVDPQQMGKLRNDIAHGNAGVDLGLLRTAHDQAFDLARRSVLQELGIA